MGFATIDNYLVTGPAGALECLLKIPPAGARPPGAAALVCHPHPLFGGTMHNKVVHAAATALSSAGFPVARFNFRGVGRSDGIHDSGTGEQEDVRAVLSDLAARYPGLPLILAGYSFGAWVGMRAACQDKRVAALIGIGVPVALYDFSFLGACPHPVVLIQGQNDQFGPLPQVLALGAALPGGAKVLPVAGAQHNFDGRLEELGRRVKEAIPQDLSSR